MGAGHPCVLWGKKKNEKMKWGNEGTRLGIGVGGWSGRKNP